jgi:DNA-binding SARP family transcriptional activator
MQIQRLEWAFKQREIPPEALLQNQEQLALLRAEREAVKDRHSRLLLEHHQAFHPIWGQLLKTGYQNSRYGHQIDRFACLYTSHVSAGGVECWRRGAASCWWRCMYGSSFF